MLGLDLHHVILSHSQQTLPHHPVQLRYADEEHERLGVSGEQEGLCAIEVQLFAWCRLFVFYMRTCRAHFHTACTCERSRMSQVRDFAVHRMHTSGFHAPILTGTLGNFLENKRACQSVCLCSEPLAHLKA